MTSYRGHGYGAARMVRRQARGEAPLTQQRRAPRGGAALEEQRQVLGSVDVETEPRHAGATTGEEPALARGLEMIVEGGLAELQRHDVGRREESGIGPEAGERGDEHRPAAAASALDTAVISSAVTHGHVAGNGEEARRAPRVRLSLRVGNRLGVAAIARARRGTRPRDGARGA